MTIDFKQAVKKPWVKWSLILCGMIAAFLVLRAFMGGGSSSGTTTDPNTSAELQAETALSAQQTQQNMQAAAIGAQAASQSSQQSAQLALQQEQDATSLSAQKENDASQFQLAGIQLQGLLDQLTAQTTQQSNALNTQLSLANVTANEQEQIAAGQNALVADVNQSNNQTQTTLAQIMAGVENTSINANLNVASINANEATTINSQNTNAAIQIAQSNNDTTKTISGNQTSASKTNSIVSTLGTVASVAAMFL